MLRNNIVADNRTSGGDLDSGTDVDSFGDVFAQPFGTFGSNRIGDGNAAGVFNGAQSIPNGDRPGVTAAQLKLGALAANGGPTLTRALLAGSVAIDASGTGLATDQRGVSRPQGNAPDIGAFESAPALSDVSASISVLRSIAGRNRATGRYKETLVLKNTSASSLSGPFYLVLENISSNITLFNQSGTTSSAPAGRPCLTVSIASLPAGASQYVVLEFTPSDNLTYSYSTRILSGNLAP